MIIWNGILSTRVAEVQVTECWLYNVKSFKVVWTTFVWREDICRYRRRPTGLSGAKLLWPGTSRGTAHRTNLAPTSFAKSLSNASTFGTITIAREYSSSPTPRDTHKPTCTAIPINTIILLQDYSKWFIRFQLILSCILKVFRLWVIL